ncbi:MAG: cytidylate kinase family protein [Thermoproteota archaeon]|nr:cytidylate kinase family protein [Thermoproteota archaeon]
MVLCVCGLSGSGKSTVAKRLAEQYGLRYVSGGDALRALAVERGYRAVERGWWESDDGMRFLKERTDDFSFDREIDEKLLECAREGNVVLDSWTMPWLFDGGFKVWLNCPVKVRAKRLMKRNNIGFEEALKALRMKEERTKEIYFRLYSFHLEKDFSPFDMILNTDFLAVDEVFDTLCLVTDKWVLGKR